MRNNVSKLTNKRFNKTLTGTGLRDMELMGHQFTWERGRGTSEWMEVRIDRMLISSIRLTLFDMAKLYNLEDSSSSSDYSPIFLEPTPAIRRYVKRSFLFENAWLSELMCVQIVKDNLTCHHELGIQDKINICGHKLESWSKEITSRFGNRIKLCKNEVKQLSNKRVEISVERFKEVEK